MATPTAEKLQTFFPSRYLAADGNMPHQYTVDTPQISARLIHDAALTQAANYWDGALGWFDGDTLTPELRACFFHVRSFDAANDLLTLARDLPAAPQTGDTYRLIIGGHRRSGQECFGLLVGGQLPELQPYTCANLTGVSITKAAGLLAAGDVYLSYKAATQELYLHKDGEAPGVALAATGDLTDATIFAADAASFLRLNIVAAELPTEDAVELITLTCPGTTFTPDFEGYETSGETAGKVRYRLEIIKNTAAVATMIDLAVYTACPAGEPSTITSAVTLPTTAGEFDLAEATDWPSQSFWVKNITRNDCRYIAYRSGNTLYSTAAGAGWRGFNAVDWLTGDEIRLMSDIDIALEKPDAENIFSNPVDESEAPADLNFGEYSAATAALSAGDLPAGKCLGIWRRETIVPEHRSRANIRSDTIVFWS